MKWGVRRYQNKDGSLTPKGKKRVSKQYRKYMNRASIAAEMMGADDEGYNRAVNRMNNGLTDRYNNEYDKRLGPKAKNHDFINDEVYDNGYADLFDSVIDKEVASVKLNTYKNNRSYNKAQSLAKKYNMESFDNFVKERNKYISDLKKIANDESDPVKKALKQNPLKDKKTVKKMIKNYDMSDPDSEEALAILREIEKDF